MKYLLFTFLLLSNIAFAQEFTPIYDESEIPDYTLPQLLRAKRGMPITTTDQWQKERRPEIIDRFESYMYGKVPEGEVDVDMKVVKELEVLG
jgi:hypothetical protein